MGIGMVLFCFLSAISRVALWGLLVMPSTARPSPPAPLTVGNFEAKFTTERGGSVIRTVVTRGSMDGGEQTQLSWADVLQELSGEGPSLRSLLSQALQEMPFEAFFWECPPLSLATKTRPFEFVVVDAPHLVHI